MARADMGSVTVTTSGTAVQITSSIISGSKVRSNDVVLTVEITPRATNTGAAMYVGNSGVSSTYGKRVAKGDSYTFNCEPGGDKFNSFYIDSDASGDIADWTVVFV
jgi:hypothetical protein